MKRQGYIDIQPILLCIAQFNYYAQKKNIFQMAIYVLAQWLIKFPCRDEAILIPINEVKFYLSDAVVELQLLKGDDSILC